MIDKNATKYIAENRMQARRDLESAKILLSQPNPHLENVAFLLEQSYEKSLKASYAKYKLETTSDSWEKVYNIVRGHDIDFMFKMLRSIHQDYWKLITQHKETASLVKSLNLLPPKIEHVMDRPDLILDKIMKRMDILEHYVRRTIKNKEHFVKFLSQLNSKSIKETNIERTDIPMSLNVKDDIKNKISNTSNTDMLNTKTWPKYITFFNMLKTLAPYTLPHAIAGRYPLKECKMKNLEAYRDFPNLKGFFDILAYKSQILLNSEADFTKHLIITHLAVSKMSNSH